MIRLKDFNELIKYYYSFLSLDLAKIVFSLPQKTEKNALEHLEAGVGWICRAQDVFDGGGVARSYSLVYNRYFERKGWTHPYPETTGYIIPTMFDYASLIGDQKIRERAIRMADWECRIQMENGAIQGGTVNQPASPAIFNTGQVIFGWLRAYQETRDRHYLDCATKAGNFLVGQQEKNGAWQKNLSEYASSKMAFYTYNTRTAWALLELSSFPGNEVFRDAAIRNINFALCQQLDNGWFKSNCLSKPLEPLLHTIAYCTRGILETGVFLNNNDYVAKARLTADALLARQRNDGSLAGRFNDRWEPAVSWSCLTGNSQTAIIWGRLYEMTKERKYLEGLKKANRYMKRIQLLQTENPDIYGGIAGSFPIHGTYGRFEILNWAVKFFLDALMLEMRVEHDGSIK